MTPQPPDQPQESPDERIERAVIEIEQITFVTDDGSPAFNLAEAALAILLNDPAPEQGEAQEPCETCNDTGRIPADHSEGAAGQPCPDCKQGEAASEERVDAVLHVEGWDAIRSLSSPPPEAASVCTCVLLSESDGGGAAIAVDCPQHGRQPAPPEAASVCPTCGLGVYLGWKKGCKSPFHDTPPPTEEIAEERPTWVCEKCGTCRPFGEADCGFCGAKPPISVPASALAAERKRAEGLQAERDEWETAAKETAVQGASNAAWKGEAWESLRSIRDITTSEEIKAIVDGLIGTDDADA